MTDIFLPKDQEAIKRWALVKDSVVINVIMADQDFIDQIKKDYDFCIQTDDGSPGYSYDGTVFVPPPPSDLPE